MTSGAVLAFGVAAIAALIDWWSVARADERTEAVAKPAVLAALVVAAALADLDTVVQALLVAALTLSLVGDVLLLPGVDRFLAGLGAFLLAHVAYAASFAAVGLQWSVVLIVGAAMAAVAVIVVRRFEGGPQKAVQAYVVVLVAMLALAAGTSLTIVVTGAALFVASDAVLGWNRFARPIEHGRLITHVLYHSGQALIVAGLAAA